MVPCPVTSKQRIKAAVAHQSTDRVPIDYYARDEITAALQQRLGLDTEDELLDLLGVDIRIVHPRFIGETVPFAYADPTVEVTPEGLHRDIWGVGFAANQTDTGFYMDHAESPLRNIESDEQIDAHPWPTADLWDYSHLAAEAAALGDRCVRAHSRGICEISWFLRGFDEFLLDLAIRPNRAARLMDHVQGYLMERTRCILDTASDLVDMVEYNDDIASQRGLFLSPAMWRQHLKPRFAAFVEMCRPYDVAIRYHCCGGLRAIIPDLIEIGVDILNPMQTVAAGMEPTALKRDFGDAITFDGGIDTQDLLPHATPDQVRTETQRMIDILGESGGYILGPAHAFQADVPLDNIIAMYETALGRPLA
jgi:uroporphyrinogen decarboxylase